MKAPFHVTHAATMTRAPFPYAGGKRKAAGLVWEALGNCRVYVEPFFGSGAVLLNRPHEPGIETINDASGLLCNVWRALKFAPDATADHADYPVSEIDLHARHLELVQRESEVRAKLEADPRWCDPELAGWWIWGASQWIGGGWCSRRERTTWRSRPSLGDSARGINDPLGTWQQRPHLTGRGNGAHALNAGYRIREWFAELSSRLRRVRIVCGDFARVLTKSPLRVEGSNVAGVFLDPPYSHDLRDGDLYAHEDDDAHVRARDWAIENGDNLRLRIVLAGLEGEHDMPAGWRCGAWNAPNGLGLKSGNRHRERLWFSPACLGARQPSLWGAA